MPFTKRSRTIKQEKTPTGVKLEMAEEEEEQQQQQQQQLNDLDDLDRKYCKQKARRLALITSEDAACYDQELMAIKSHWDCFDSIFKHPQFTSEKLFEWHPRNFTCEPPLVMSVRSFSATDLNNLKLSHPSLFEAQIVYFEAGISGCLTQHCGKLSDGRFFWIHFRYVATIHISPRIHLLDYSVRHETNKLENGCVQVTVLCSDKHESLSVLSLRQLMALFPFLS